MICKYSLIIHVRLMYTHACIIILYIIYYHMFYGRNVFQCVGAGASHAGLCELKIENVRFDEGHDFDFFLAIWNGDD